MTNDERDQVVELLRCAADLHETGGTFFPIDDAATATFGETHDLHPIANLACDAVQAAGLGPCSVEQLLEAAQLVEDGTLL
jgi:hypothetical protein